MGDSDLSGASFAGEAPKKKIATFCHWARPKSTLYEYNMDNYSNYYRPMIEYLDQRQSGYRPETPKPLYWEERAMNSYMDRNRRTQSVRVSRDALLLQNIRSSSSHYIQHSKAYARKITGTGF